MKKALGIFYILATFVLISEAHAQSKRSADLDSIHLDGANSTGEIGDMTANGTQLSTVAGQAASAATATALAAEAQRAQAAEVAAMVAASAAQATANAALVRSSNLSDLTSPSTARTNLGLGGAAVLGVGTTTGTLAAGDDSRITGALSAATAASTYAPLVSPSLTTPNLGTPSAGVLTNATGLPVSTGLAGAGTGVTAALGQAVTGSGGIVLATGGDVSANKVTAGIQARTLATRALDWRNAQEWAACDGTTDDSNALTTAQAGGYPVTIRSGLTCYAASIGFTGLTATFSGPGQVKTSDGYLRAPLTSGLSTQPTVYSGSGANALFSGDVSHVGIAHEHILTGTALGQPSSGYYQKIESAAEILALYNTSGYVSSLNGTGGRTGGTGKWFNISQYGQGDLTAMGCFGGVGSSLTGATTYLASPEAACLEGNMIGLTNGAYIEFLGDMDISDSGHDIAAVGAVWNLNRTNAAEAIGANWSAVIAQSTGTAPVDNFFVGRGPAAMGLDLSQGSFIYSRAAILAATGGTGYVIGDKLTVSGGNALTPTTLIVATVSSGAILTTTVGNSGLYTTPPLANGAYGALTVTGGSGTGASVSGAYSAGNAIVLPGSGGCFAPATKVGSPTTVLAGYYGTLCLSTGSLVWGQGNSVPAPFGGLNDVVIGSGNQAYGTNNFLLGLDANDEAGTGALFWANGTPSGYGAAQTSWRNMFGSGAGGSAIRLTSNGAAASAANSYPVVASSASSVALRVTLIDETNGDAASWKWKSGMLTRVGAANTVYTGDASTATTPDYSTGSASTATLTISADTSHQGISVSVTPPSNGHTWHANAKLDADQAQ